MVGQALIEHAVMTLDFLEVTVFCVGQVFRGVVQEVHRLTREWRQAGGDEHQPRQQLGLAGNGGRQEALMFLREVQQDRLGVEHGGVAIDQRWHFGVRVDRQEGWLVLLALEGVDADQFVRRLQFFEQQGDFHRVWRRVEKEFHGVGLSQWLVRN
ncbi:hypothetical protein D3C84_447200 [compost metagenome]